VKLTFLTSLTTILLIQFSFQLAHAQLAHAQLATDGHVTDSKESLTSDVTPESSDYQPYSQGAMVTKGARLQSYAGEEGNETAGIAGSANDANESLADKFIRAVGPDATESLWLNSAWKDSLKPMTAGDSAGKCDIWSAWSLDPEVMKSLNNLNDGIICNGVTFTRGEIKELLTALYPHPDLKTYFNSSLSKQGWAATVNQMHSSGYTAPDYYVNQADQEESANLAQAKMAFLSGGENGQLSPLEFMSQARNAYHPKNGETKSALMMDIDPGTQIWHQPIQNITDVMNSPSTNRDRLNDYYGIAVSASNLDVVPSTPAHPLSAEEQQTNLDLLTDMRWMERRLTTALPSGNALDTSTEATFVQVVNFMRSKLPANFPWRNSLDGLKSDPSKKASLETNILNELKAATIESFQHGNSHLRLVNKVEVIPHTITITYAKEGYFGKSKKEALRKVTYHYIEVKGADGSVHTVWSPHTMHLSQICKADGTVSPAVSARIISSAVYTVDFPTKCAAYLKTGQDEEFFADGVMPRALKVFKPTPHFKDENQKAAFDHLRRFMDQCDHDSFNKAMKFLRDLDGVCRENEVTTDQAKDLGAEFRDARSMIDCSYLKDKMRGCQSLTWNPCP
jgi:hypothetical protein